MVAPAVCRPADSTCTSIQLPKAAHACTVGLPVKGAAEHQNPAGQEVVWKHQGGGAEAAGELQGGDGFQGGLTLSMWKRE